MSKRYVIILGVLVATVILWRLNTPANEPRSTNISSNSPKETAVPGSAPMAVSQNETVAKSVKPNPEKVPENFNPRAQALAAFAQKQKAAGLDKPTELGLPTQIYQNLPKTKTRNINEKPFQILGARAVPRAEYSASMGDILFEHNGFVVVALPRASDDNWQKLMWNNSDRPVLINPSNGRLAIVTGTLVVKLHDMAAADRLAAQENLTVIGKDESIKTVYYRPSADYALLTGQQRLQKQTDVERVEIELYQSRKEAR